MTKTYKKLTEPNYCEEHDEEIKGEVCSCCVRLEETGYAYECSDHGYHENGCISCSYDDSKIDSSRGK